MPIMEAPAQGARPRAPTTKRLRNIQLCRLSTAQIPAFSTPGLLDAGETGKDASHWDKR